MNIRPREDWQSPSQPVVGPQIRLNKVELVPAHYTAARKIPTGIPAYLRNIQNDYTVNRGYSIGYNFAIDQTGTGWEIRGFDIRCAANLNMNDVTIAILCLVDGADEMNEAMIDTFQWIAAEAERIVGTDLLVVGHRDIGKTTCPGDGVYSQVQAGLLEPEPEPEPEPGPEPTPITNEEIDMLALDFGVPPDQPNPDDWWTRLTYTGDSLCHVRSPFDQVQARGKVTVVPINEDELNAMLDTIQTVGDSPFQQGGQAPNAGLHSKWEAARGRT
jgi:N-acetylmuramoyl-L-alanine amidase